MTKWNLKVSGDVLAGSRTEHIPVFSGIMLSKDFMDP